MNKYISFDIEKTFAYQLFEDHIKNKYRCLHILRDNNNNKIEFDCKKILLDNNFSIEKDLIEIIKNNKNKDNKDFGIMLERLDYLIIQFGFENIIKRLYLINDLLKDTDSLFIIHIDNDFLEKKDKNILKNEFDELPKPDILNNIRLDDYLIDILNMINNSNKKISIKNVCKNLNITKNTARKRINELNSKGLLDIIKNGRSKILEITQKGKIIL